MINSEVDRKKFKDALQEISNSFTRTAAEKDLIKEIVDDLAESFELPKKTVNKLARIYYKQNLSQEVEEFDEVQTLYEEIVNFTK
jgi:uncharacterized protein YydD (DUF2326 family)